MKLVFKFIISILVLKIGEIFISYYINDNVKDLHNDLSSRKSHCINKCGLQVPKCESKCQMDFRNFDYSEVAKCTKNCETIEDCIANCYHNWIMNVE